MNDQYAEFLKSKVVMAQPLGFEIDDSEIHPILKPHQRAIVKWAVRGGRRAIFAAFGLGKSVMQIEIVRIVRQRAGGMGLIVIPLGVRQEFTRDAAMLGVHVKFIRRIEEADDLEGIYLTNYETVRDEKLDPRRFTVASLDEASALRGFGGTKTFRSFMALFAGDDRRDMSNRILGEEIRYRFVATATPSPNDYIELLAYSAFLGVMDVSAAPFAKPAEPVTWERVKAYATDWLYPADKEGEFCGGERALTLFVQAITGEIDGIPAPFISRQLAPVAQPAPEPLTYTVAGVVMTVLEYIDYLHSQLRQKTQAQEPVATKEAFAVRFDNKSKSGWVQDSYGFPALFSKDNAQSMCCSAEYSVRTLRICAFDVDAAPVAQPAAPMTVAGNVQLAPSRANRIYVAGPMTGLPDYNFPAFNEAAAMLRETGWHVENPVDHGFVEGATWADYLRYDIARLATCSTIYLLPGWSKSKGVALEVHIANALGMAIQYAQGAEPAAPMTDEAICAALKFEGMQTHTSYHSEVGLRFEMLNSTRAIIKAFRRLLGSDKADGRNG